MLLSRLNEGLTDFSLLDRLRLRYVQLISLLIVITPITALLARQLAPEWTYIYEQPLSFIVAIAFGAVSLIVATTGGQRTRRLMVYVLVAGLTASTISAPQNAVTMVILLSSTSAALLISNRAVYFSVLILLLGRVLAPVFFDIGADGIQVALSPDLFTFAIYGFAIVLTSVIVRQFILALENTSSSATETAVLLEASADIGQTIAERLDQDDLLSQTVEIISGRFNYYHVQVFLLDENGEYAYLAASTGEVGKLMLARQHRLPVDAQSVVGRVILAQEPIIARTGDEGGGRTANELLPDTRSELGVPLIDNQGLIGTLDVQSRQGNAFNETEIRVLRVIAAQLATAIRNARLFETQRRNVEENKRLFIESETNLREIQRLNQQLTRQAWSDYLQNRQRVTGVTLTNQDLVPQAEWTDDMREAMRKRRPIVNANNNQRITVPVELRGEVVGVIEIETENAASEDTIDMMQAIAQRLAVSMDSARLFEESQRANLQEQRIGELVSQYQSANTIDELLQWTLEGVTETLGAQGGSIRLGVVDDEENAVLASENGDAANGHREEDINP